MINSSILKSNKSDKLDEQTLNNMKLPEIKKIAEQSGLYYSKSTLVWTSPTDDNSIFGKQTSVHTPPSAR